MLLRRGDLAAAQRALESVGFIYRRVAGIDAFLDGPTAKMREAVHVIFAGERVRSHETSVNPDVTDSHDTGTFRVLTLEALVQIKLTAWRDKDRTHLRDLIDVGLMDRSWTNRFPAPLAERLTSLLDSPEG